MMETQNLDDDGRQEREVSTKTKIPKVANDLPADLRMDEYSSDEDQDDIKKTAAIGDLLVEDASYDDEAPVPYRTRKSADATDMDSDDSDDDLDDVPDTREYTPLDLDAFDSLGISKVGTKTPTYMEMLEGGDGEDDDSDAADVQIRDGDALLVIAKADEVSSLVHRGVCGLWRSIELIDWCEGVWITGGACLRAGYGQPIHSPRYPPPFLSDLLGPW